MWVVMLPLRCVLGLQMRATACFEGRVNQVRLLRVVTSSVAVVLAADVPRAVLPSEVQCITVWCSRPPEALLKCTLDSRILILVVIIIVFVVICSNGLQRGRPSKRH